MITFPQFVFGHGLRYLLAPLAGLALAFFHGTRYVQDIYNIKSFDVALKYLLSSMFAIKYPRLVISEGKRQLAVGEVNTIDIIGGPGFVDIEPGNVVLFGRLQGPSNVRAGGVHFISRFETIKEIASLDDQEAHIKTKKAVTRDGIEVEIHDVKFRYRLISGHRGGSSGPRPSDNPYPFSIEAIRNLAYNRSVSSNGLSSWAAAVGNVIDGVISAYINSHTFDQITSPVDDKAPRDEISQQLHSPRTRQDLKALGAELLWFDIGYFTGPEGETSHFNAWEARMVGDSNVTLADSEAQRLAEQEIGRAQAQADLLENILKELKNVELDNSDLNVRSLLLLRTAQVVESMTSFNRPAELIDVEEAEPDERPDS